MYIENLPLSEVDRAGETLEDTTYLQTENSNWVFSKAAPAHQQTLASCSVARLASIGQACPSATRQGSQADRPDKFIGLGEERIEILSRQSEGRLKSRAYTLGPRIPIQC